MQPPHGLGKEENASSTAGTPLGFGLAGFFLALKAVGQGAVGFGGAAGHAERSRAEGVPGHLEEFFHPVHRGTGKKA